MPVAKGRAQRILGMTDSRRPVGRRRHGLTALEVEAMKRRQLGCCAICQRPGLKLEVDHDHRHCAGSEGCRQCVRGLLCRKCNQALGDLKDVNIPRLLIYLGGR